MEKTRKKSQAAHVPQNDSEQVFQEPMADRIAHWVQEHGSTVLYTGAGIILLLIALYVWSYRTAGADEADYLQATVSYREFSTIGADVTDPSNSPSFVQLKEIMERHPELGARYNGLITQTFLRLGDMKMALQYGQKALQELTKENLPFYEDFSKTSLLIADASYADALKRSEFLGKKMNESLAGNREPQVRGFGDVLFISNLIRQAMLQQRLTNVEGELIAWQELQRIAGLQSDSPKVGPIDREAFARVAGTFKTGKLNLIDYIEARKKALR